jgi:dephospho-CoA kinase
MFVERGALLVRADEIAHDLMKPGGPMYTRILQHFGPSVVHPDGSIDRRKLADAAFGGGRVEELNGLVHPEVIAAQERWMEDAGRHDPRAVAIVEAALILEAGVQGRFDKLVVVTCRPEQKAERFAARQQLSPESAQAEVNRRSAAQLPDEDKARAADYVIDNSGALADTARQVDAVWKELKLLAVGN